MSFKAIVRELTKEIRDGIGSISRRRGGGGGGEDGKSSARYYRRGKSHIAPDCSSTSSSLTAFVTIQEQQQSRWANLPPELLLDIIHRVEASETAWPARKDVVACASVCRSWRDITKEIVKTPEQCGSLTFPISLKQVFFSSNKKENKFNSFEPRAQTKTVYFSTSLWGGLSFVCIDILFLLICVIAWPKGCSDPMLYKEGKGDLDLSSLSWFEPW